jgi:hypothetical protein
LLHESGQGSQSDEGEADPYEVHELHSKRKGGALAGWDASHPAP